MAMIIVSYFYKNYNVLTQNVGHAAMASVPIVGDCMTIAESASVRVVKRNWIVHRNATMELHIILE